MLIFNYNLELNIGVKYFRLEYEPYVYSYCLLCKNKYNEYPDPFRIVKDTKTFNDITYELCLECVYSFSSCNECNRDFNESYDCVYYNFENKRYYCECCYNDKRNKRYKKCLISYCKNSYCKSMHKK